MEEYSAYSRISWAIQKNNLTLLQNLLKEGHRIDFKDENGCTPLHLTMNDNNYRRGCVNLLLNYHLDPPVNDQNNEGCTCLYLACKKNLKENLIKDLLENNADPNIANFDLIAPIHVACQNKNINVVKLLHKYGADMNAQNKYNNTPLHCAIQSGAKDIVTYLLKNNIADLSLKGSLGYNALMCAIYSHEDEIIDLVLPFTSNLNDVGNRKETALDLAVEANNLRVVVKLIDKGISVNNDRFDYLISSRNLYIGNIGMFEYIWFAIEPEIILRKIERLLTRTLCVQRHLTQLQIILQTANISSVLTDVRGIFKRLFKFILDHPTEKYFEKNKYGLIILVKKLVNQKIKLNCDDLTTFMNFLTYCPYRLQLLKIAVENLDLKVDMQVVGVAFFIHPEFGMFFLQYSVPYLDSCIYSILLVKKGNIKDLNYLFPFFTPKNLHTYSMYEKDKYKVKKYRKYFFGNVQSLKEISRDVARQHIGELYVNNENEKVTEFSNIVGKLDVPTIIKDILLFKKPVTGLS